MRMAKVDIVYVRNSLGDCTVSETVTTLRETAHLRQDRLSRTLVKSGHADVKWHEALWCGIAVLLSCCC